MILIYGLKFTLKLAIINKFEIDTVINLSDFLIKDIYIVFWIFPYREETTSLVQPSNFSGNSFS